MWRAFSFYTEQNCVMVSDNSLDDRCLNFMVTIGYINAALTDFYFSRAANCFTILHRSNI